MLEAISTHTSSRVAYATPNNRQPLLNLLYKQSNQTLHRISRASQVQSRRRQVNAWPVFSMRCKHQQPHTPHAATQQMKHTRARLHASQPPHISLSRRWVSCEVARKVIATKGPVNGAAPQRSTPRTLPHTHSNHTTSPPSKSADQAMGKPGNGATCGSTHTHTHTRATTRSHHQKQRGEESGEGRRFTISG